MACKQQDSNQPDVHQAKSDDACAIEEFDCHGAVLSRGIVREFNTIHPRASLGMCSLCHSLLRQNNKTLAHFNDTFDRLHRHFERLANEVEQAMMKGRVQTF